MALLLLIAVLLCLTISALLSIEIFGNIMVGPVIIFLLVVMPTKTNKGEKDET